MSPKNYLSTIKFIKSVYDGISLEWKEPDYTSGRPKKEVCYQLIIFGRNSMIPKPINAFCAGFHQLYKKFLTKQKIVNFAFIWLCLLFKMQYASLFAKYQGFFYIFSINVLYKVLSLQTKYLQTRTWFFTSFWNNLISNSVFYSRFYQKMAQLP